ncbi:MAG: hypothetical protein RL521_1387, partial [Bacteroidota bacterium]
CDGNIDDGGTLTTFYADADGDSFGDLNTTRSLFLSLASHKNQRAFKRFSCPNLSWIN